MIKKRVTDFFVEEEGMGTVEMILIIVDIRGKPKLCKYCLMQMAFR